MAELGQAQMKLGFLGKLKIWQVPACSCSSMVCGVPTQIVPPSTKYVWCPHSQYTLSLCSVPPILRLNWIINPSQLVSPSVALPAELVLHYFYQLFAFYLISSFEKISWGALYTRLIVLCHIKTPMRSWECKTQKTFLKCQITCGSNPFRPPLEFWAPNFETEVLASTYFQVLTQEKNKKKIEVSTERNPAKTFVHPIQYQA